MGRKKVVMTPVTIDEDEPEEKSPAQVEAEEIMETVELEAGARVEARIHRRHPSYGNREAIVDTIDASAFSRDYIRDQYGGGSYRIVFIGPTRGKNGKPGRGQLKQETFEVDPSIPPTHPKAKLATGPVHNADGTSPVNTSTDRMNAIMEGGLLNLFQSMQSMQQMQLAIVERAMREPEKSRGPDWTAVVGAAAPIVSALIQMMGTRRDPMEAAKEIAELATRNTGKGSAMEELRAMIEVARELNLGGASKETGWMDLVQSLGPKLIEAARGAESVPSEIPVAPPQPAIALGTNQPTPMHTPAPPLPAAYLTPFLPFLPHIESAARSGMATDLAAEFFVHLVPESALPELEDILDRSSLVADILVAQPRLGRHREWLEVLRTEMLSVLRGDDDDGSGGAEHGAENVKTE